MNLTNEQKIFLKVIVIAGLANFVDHDYDDIDEENLRKEYCLKWQKYAEIMENKIPDVSSEDWMKNLDEVVQIVFGEKLF